MLPKIAFSRLNQSAFQSPAPVYLLVNVFKPRFLLIRQTLHNGFVPIFPVLYVLFQFGTPVHYYAGGGIVQGMRQTYVIEVKLP